MKTLTNKQYQKLTEVEKANYVPDKYSKYEEVTGEGECFECGHVTQVKMLRPTKDAKVLTWRTGFENGVFTSTLWANEANKMIKNTLLINSPKP